MSQNTTPVATTIIEARDPFFKSPLFTLKFIGGKRLLLEFKLLVLVIRAYQFI